MNQATEREEESEEEEEDDEGGGASSGGQRGEGEAVRKPITTADPQSFSRVDPARPAKVRPPLGIRVKCQFVSASSF